MSSSVTSKSTCFYGEELSAEFKGYYCPECDNTLGNVSNEELTQHYTNKHLESGDGGVKNCTICGASVRGDAIYNHYFYNHLKSIYTSYKYIFTEVNCNNTVKKANGEEINCGESNEYSIDLESQRLFIVDKSQSNIEDETEIDIKLSPPITVTKVWSDSENRYGKRPDSITFKLYGRNDSNEDWTLIDGTYTMSSESDKSKDKDNVWEKTFYDISIYNEYKIEEETPNGYKASYSSGKDKNGTLKTDGTIVSNKITVTNKIITKNIVIKKVWKDEGNKYNTRPSTINIMLRRTENDSNDQLNNSVTYPHWTDWDQTLSGSIKVGEWTEWTRNGNEWTMSIKDVPITNSKGILCFYNVKETDKGLSNEDKNKLKCYFTTYESYRSSTGKWTQNPYVIITSSINEVRITNTLKTLDIDITKIWDDYNNAYGLRPDNENDIKNDIKFTLTRYNEKTTKWDTLTEGTDYTFNWTKTGNTDSSWNGKITGLLAVNPETGNSYRYKVEEKIEGNTNNYYKTDLTTQGQEVKYDGNTANQTKYITVKNKLKTIEISGCVWLDGQTGNKNAEAPNGIMDEKGKGMAGITVHLYYKQPIDGKQIEEWKDVKLTSTTTDTGGKYTFKDENNKTIKFEIGYYYVKFEYDGINYEDTIKVEQPKDDEIVSKAFEKVEDRDTFNKKFHTIEKGTAIGVDGNTITLEYDYDEGKDNENGKSTLITQDEKGLKEKFKMNAVTNGGKPELFESNQNDLNLGLVERHMDIGLTTGATQGTVTINGKETIYTGDIEHGSTEDSTFTYNKQMVYLADYIYRLHDYEDQVKGTADGIPEDMQTGDQLEISVEYLLKLSNYGTEEVTINEVLYEYDKKYKKFDQEILNVTVHDSKGVRTQSLNSESIGDNKIKIKGGIEISGNGYAEITLTFKVNYKDNDKKNGLDLGKDGKFTNKAEITSYSTGKGLIDNDSQPGNFFMDNKYTEDDSATCDYKINVEKETVRQITGKVFDEENNNVNDVIVQLIELSKYGDSVYEYIWQETVSGTGKGIKMNSAGTGTEEYTYTKNDGTYEFAGFIPGDYIVRFIYGDGTTYDMTENVIKYNGQDYKSMEDSNYNAEWYKSSTYTAGASVARDNEARRLETIAYSAEIDAEKGILLKLLNNVSASTLNRTEKEILVATYNKYHDDDIEYTEIEKVKDDTINNAINNLLKDVVLKNTWMCAETSKINVAVDTDDITKTDASITVDGTKKDTYVNKISNINLGLELRPTTQIELKKYITGFKLLASNGQTLVNASIDINNYFNNEEDKSTYVQGIKDSVTILGTKWQYEVAPVDINSVVDGANLEFQYTLVVKNTGEDDYISETLADAYNSKSIKEYKTYLNDGVAEIKGYMRDGTYSSKIGTYIGSNYYKGGNSGNKVLTEVTNIRDYINNDLTFVTSGGNVAVDETVSNSVHRILRDDYSMQTATIKTILKTTQPTGKMQNNGEVVLYTVTLGKNPISSTGNLNFENYIAEVMSYTNAVGRRSMTSTPGNAEIIDHENREGKTHEIDEADTASIQIGTATGEDEKANYVIIIAVAGALVVMAVGAILVKKYVIK